MSNSAPTPADNGIERAMEPNPRFFIDHNGAYQSERTGVEKLAHDAWIASTTWDLSRDDFIRLSCFHGCIESGSDGFGPVNGSEDRPNDVVYRDADGRVLTRSMVSYWFADSNSFMHGYTAAAKDPALRAHLEAIVPKAAEPVASHWPILLAILRPAIATGQQAVLHHARRLVEVLHGEKRAALVDLLERGPQTFVPVVASAPSQGPDTTAVLREADAMPILPPSLLAAIGEYGLARTDGVSDIERLHRWQLLIDAIKSYARASLSASQQTAASGAREALRPMATAPKDGTPVLLKFAEFIPRSTMDGFAGKVFVGSNRGDMMLWSFAAPVGTGGFPDEWMEGWFPLPSIAAIASQEGGGT